jgi:sec-independent protein translocase protein TatB
MFDVGFAEIFLLALVGLIVLGPEKLPRVARTVGGLVRRARSSWYSLRRSIEAELAEADISEPIKKAASDLEASVDNLDQGLKEITKAANETVALESDCGTDNDTGKLQGG